MYINPYTSFAPVDSTKAAAIAEKLFALNTGMTYEELLEMVQYIEMAKQAFGNFLCYLRKEESSLPRTIEFDPISQKIFIHLKTHNIAFLGKGAHKYVTKSILYDAREPKLVATAIVEIDEKVEAELTLLRQFQDIDQIIKLLYVNKHEKKNGKWRYEIVTPLFNCNSLKKLLQAKPKMLPFAAKLKIALDIVRGSNALNRRGYVNRDNHAGNFFVQEDKAVFRAVLGDLGGYTHTLTEARLLKPFGPSPYSAPPDLLRAYYADSLRDEDMLSHHVYSLARVLYQLYFEEHVIWLNDFELFYPAIKHMNKDRTNSAIPDEIERLDAAIRGHIQPHLDALANRPLTQDEEFELMIWQMLSPDAATRQTLAYWQDQLEDLYARCNSS